MPYRQSHFYMIALIAITVIAFWPSYFGVLDKAPLAHHLHGITGTAWILLIAVQGWLIHAGHRQAHRLIAQLMFVLVPLMVGAFALVTLEGARQTVAQHPFYMAFGKALLTADVTLAIGTSLMVYLALRYRRQVNLHGGLMIATVIGLLPPILSRLFVNHLPGMIITGPDTLYLFGYALHLSMLISVALAVFLYFRNRPDAWPWLLAAVMTALTDILYMTLGQSEAWLQVVHVMAEFDSLAVFASGALLGALACYAGLWQPPILPQRKKSVSARAEQVEANR